LGPLDTAATSRPIVPTLADYDGGEIGGMIGRENQSTRRKPVPVPLCPPQNPHALPGREPEPPRWEASDYPLELWHGLRFYFVIGQLTNHMIHPSIYSCCSLLKHRASEKRFVSLQFLRQSVVLLERGISPTQGRYLHRTTQTQNKRRQTSMP
jgi:hypothetical protein